MTHRVRRANRKPSFESMESRTLLSGAGVNLGFNWSYYGDYLWADVGNAMQAWNSTDPARYWENDPKIPTTPLGYALRDASATVNLSDYPDGIYQVSFRGTVAVDFWGVGELMEPLVKGPDGVTRGRVLVGEGHENPLSHRTLVMTVSGIDANDPMSDLHIWSPGYGPGGPMYTSQFLQNLQPFDHIRFLNWSKANESVEVDWSDRQPEGAFPKTNSPKANRVPYEDLIELANESGKDMWLNVPALANDQYVENLARLVRERLDPGLKIYIEYSNETWNTAFTQYSQVLAIAEADPRVTKPGAIGKVAQETALKLKWVSDIFREEFGDSFDRVIPVLGGWVVTPNFMKFGLELIDQLYGAPSQYIKAVAVAPYISVPKGNDVRTMSRSQIFDALNQGLDERLAFVRQHVELAGAYGLPVDGYEMGVDNYSFKKLSDAAREAIYDDPRMYDLIRRYQATWVEVGARQPTYFTFDTPGWGLKRAVLSPGAQRWDAVLSTLLQPGDATLDGAVDFADFQALASHYQASGQWWQQGDFNHDGVVNQTDLRALLSRLDGGSLTADQAVEVITFTTTAPVALDRALELGVFARQYASDYPFAAETNQGGPVARDRVFNGKSSGNGPLTLGGVVHDRGLGVSSASSIDLNLGGNFTTFAAIIGVDDRAGAGKGRSTFQVVGDGRVLYASPVLRAGDAALPIEVDVRGVSTLRLIVSAPKGADQAVAADWAQARLVDSRSQSGDAPVELKWTVTKDGSTVLSTDAESFVFTPLGPGSYEVIVQATDLRGDTASRDVALELRAGAGGAEAYSHLRDATTRGDWRGAHGELGQVIAGDATNPPADVRVSVRGATVGSWDGDANDPRALRRVAAAGRVAAAWSGDLFTIDVVVAGDEPHEVTLYAVDWGSTGREQRIDVLDAATGAVIDTRAVSDFADGVYLTWSVKGSVRFRVSRLAGDDAVIGGVFFDGAELPQFQGWDAASRGSWRYVYGHEGVAIPGEKTQLPSKAEITVVDAVAKIWATSTTDARAPQKPIASDRLASAWIGGSFTINVSFADHKSHKITLYALDWTRGGRSQRIDMIDPTTGAVLDSRTIADFADGLYFTWTAKGSVQFRITRISGANAAISGVFIDEKEASPNFAGVDATSMGAWKGAFGDDGFMIAGDATRLPAGVSVTMAGDSLRLWESPSSAARALWRADEANRLAAAWASQSMTFDVSFADEKTHQVSLYAMDWQRSNRSQWIDVIDAATGEVIDSRLVADFGDGVYLSWNVQGSVQFRVTNFQGSNAVIGGLFIDPAEAPADPPPSPPPGFAGTDATTRGSWKGAFGGEGLAIAGDATQLPAGVSMAVNAGSIWTWERSTSDPRGLQKATATDRLAAAWLHRSLITIDVSFADEKTHKVSLYALDWSLAGREQRIDVIDAATGKVIDSRTIADFGDGVYLSWNVKGSVQFRVSKVGGPNVVISGLFIDPAEAPADPPPSPPPGFGGADAATGGSWKGTFGGGGFTIAGDATQLPAGVATAVNAGSIWTWERSTNDPRGLQKATAADRLAAAWLHRSLITIDVSFADEKTHKVSLYALDWSLAGREQRIEVIDAATGKVIDSRTIADFGDGVYLSWNAKGSVQFRVSNVGGPNVVISGLFID